MRCPYCQTEIEDNSSFCVKCGQAINQTDYVLKESNAYWSIAAEDQKKNDDQYQRMLETKKQNARNAASKRIGIVIAAVVALALVVSIVLSVNNANQEKLNIAKTSVVGKTYTDTERIPPQTLLGAAHPEIQTLKFNSDGTVDYRYDVGDYSSGWNYDIEYTKEEGTYRYEMEISFFGKITIRIIRSNGSSLTFPAEVREDGSVSRIEMFD